MAADRSDRYRERMLAKGLTKVCIWVPEGSEDSARAWAARERKRFASLAAARSRPAELNRDADLLRALTVAARLQPDMPEATLATYVRAILGGKTGADLYKARKAIKEACKSAKIATPSDRQLDAWAAEH